jgi:GT2 family glycosyltransferase
MKLSSLEKINYFDENVFLYYEENIISQKLKKIKEKIVINSDIEIIHKHSLTINKSLNEYYGYD